MECRACGYKDHGNFKETGREEDIGNGDEKFIKIEGNFTINPEFDPIHQVNLYACPKCHTVIFSKWQ